jgi:hypothetical protein
MGERKRHTQINVSKLQKDGCELFKQDIGISFIKLV